MVIDMLKRVPYNSNLISIGNAPTYDGKPVYSDGRVAYGWNYSPQVQNPPAANYSGLWIGKYNTVNERGYELVRRGLDTGRPMIGQNVAAYEYSLPWLRQYFNGLTVQNIDGQRGYDIGQYEDIVAFGNDGRLLTFNGLDKKLYQYTAAGQKTVTDLSRIDFCKDAFNQNSAQWSLIPGVLQLATPDGCYITAKLKKQAGDTAEPVFKQYFAGGGTLVERSYPAEFFIDGYNGQNGAPVVKIRLADMALTIGDVTYTGDVLGLLQAATSSSIVNPAAIHAYVLKKKNGTAAEVITGAYIMKRAELTGYLWLFDNANETFKVKEYETLRSCWCLTWLEKRLVIKELQQTI